MTPKGWREIPLGVVATLQRGYDLPVQDRRAGPFPVVASNGPVGSHDRPQVKGPGVVTGRSGTIGKVFYYEDDFWPLNTTLYVSDFHGNAPQFIARLLESMELGRFVAATGVPSLNRNFVHPVPVLIPPLGEQRKIAAILSSMDDAIEATQAVIEQLQVVKKAMMAELLTRGFPGRHGRFKETEVGKVPEGWEVVPLGRLAELQPGFPFKSAEFSQDGDRLLRGSNVGVGVLDWSPNKTVYFPPARRDEFREYVLEPGDIVVAMDRPFIADGFKIARVTEADLPGLLLQRVGRFRRYAADREYVWAVLHSDLVEGHLRIQQKGTDLPHISKAEIESCLVPRPPMDEQLQIGSIFAEMDSRILAERRHFSGLGLVKSALMSTLLTGEIRVTPDEALP